MMKIALVSHINGDGDLLEVWFQYYLRLGISSFHLIVHGSREQNATLHALKQRYPVTIEDSYEGAFDSREKGARLNSLLARLRGKWVLLADSDEFVEFPYPTVLMTIRMLQLVGTNALFAPMLQHLCLEGSLDTPSVIEDPFRTMPLCSVDLYQQMGVQASISKFPLFYCGINTAIQEGGNHNCPIGNRPSSLQGVTHHFKFRSSVSKRLSARAHSSHPWRHESVGFQSYLESNGNRLPTDGSFLYSRAELFRRRLLRKYTLMAGFERLRGKLWPVRDANSEAGPHA
jgi:Glycosyl transferase family 2